MSKKMKIPTQNRGTTPREIAELNRRLMLGYVGYEHASVVLPMMEHSWQGAVGPLKDRRVSVHRDFVLDTADAEREHALGYVGGLSVETIRFERQFRSSEAVSFYGNAILAGIYNDPERSELASAVIVSLPATFNYTHLFSRAIFTAQFRRPS